ncbi:MAG: alkaline phosphatase family protein [Planctomycetota bacterium]
MRKRQIIPLAAAAFWLGLGRPALAYLDPGTQTQIVQMLGMILGALGMSAAFLLWPFRRFLWWLRGRFGGRVARGVLVSVLALIVVVAAGAAYHLFGPEPETEEFAVNPDLSDRVIVIGMDGLSPAVLSELMETGELPNFARLRDAGTFAPAQTTLPPESPVAWSGIATGCNPGKHGIFDFLHRDPKTYRPVLSIYRVNTKNWTDKREARYLPVREAPGFWTIASEAGVLSTVIRWPSAFPPEPVSEGGRFLSGLGVPDVRGRLGRYTLFTTVDREPAEGFKGQWRYAPGGEEEFESELAGPVVSGLTGRRESTVPVVVRRMSDEQIVLEIGGGPGVKLGVGEWSDYVPVRFRAGLGKTVPALVQAYLAELAPRLRLYVSTPQVDPKDPYFPITWPDGYARELADAVGRYSTLGMPEDVNAMKDGSLSPAAFEWRMLDLFEERREQFRYELGRYEKGLFAFIFDASDRIQHMYWMTRDEDHPRYDAAFAEKFGHVIPDLYRRMDGVLGEVLDRAAALDQADPEGKKTTVIVASDHGFTTFRTTVALNTWLVEQGYMALTTADGRNGRELFADVDWSRTRAYALGFAGIYINQKGRERSGIVEPGAETDALCEELATKLRQLREPVTGELAVRNVYRAREVYHGDETADGPDLVVGFRRGFRAEDTNVLGGTTTKVFDDNMTLWTGDHLMDPHVVPGILVTNLDLRNEHPRNIDLAPTILKALGVDRPESMDGEPLY